MLKKIIIILGLTLLPSVALAHGGGLDQYGCHNDRKHGGYHCHRPQPAPEPTKKSPPPAKPKQEKRPKNGRSNKFRK